MASIVYIDTHVVAWLYEEGYGCLPEKATTEIDHCDDLRISPMVQLELQYLYEIDRVSTPPTPVLEELKALIGLTICNHSFPEIINKAAKETWTRDPFDRIIVSQSKLLNAPLITKDRLIHDHYKSSIWK